MSHYVPELNYIPKHFSTPYGRYLANLAEARAAEAEYLAAEAVQREEEALRHPLEEIELHKREQERHFRSRYGYTPYRSVGPLLDLDAHHAYSYDRLATLRRRVEAEEHLRLLSIRQAEAERARRQQAQEAYLFSPSQEEASRRLHQEREEARAAAFLDRQASKAHQSLLESAEDHQCVCHKHVRRPWPISHHSILLCPAAKNFAPTNLISAKPTVPAQPSVEVDVRDLMTQLLGGQPASKPQVPIAPPQPTQKTPTQSSDILEQFANLFGLSAKEAQQQCSTTQRGFPSAKVAPSLKEKLASRLNNESSSEVRNTIQAIFSSFDGTESHSVTSSSTAFDIGSGEGKAKAREPPHNASRFDVTAATKDVVKTMNEIRSIEAAFQALTTDFTFPAQLDFVSGSPASSYLEASATARLAYTSRNRAVRSYEQALSKLLTELDAVDSFGDDRLRAMRKEVVKRVERTLEGLEREIEGRWRSSLSQAAKPINVETTKHVPTQSAAVIEEQKDAPCGPALSQNDTTVIPDVPKVMAAEPNGSEDSSTSGPVSEAADGAPKHSSASAPTVSLSTTSDAALASIEAVATGNTSYEISIQPSISIEVSDTNDDTASFSAQGFDVEATTVEDVSSVESESREAFLLAISEDAGLALEHSNSRESDEDAGSEWSEVEA